MPNKATNYFSKALGENVTNSDLLNLIRDRASETYRSEIPEIPSTKPINHANLPYDAFTANQNEFFDILINRIGSTVINALTFENPLGVFRDETFNYGEVMQELFVHMPETETFNAKTTDSPFKFRDTKIEQFFHDINAERKYSRTIERAWTKKAFTSENSFDNFIDNMLLGLKSKDEFDEYKAVKRVITAGLNEITLGTGAVITAPAQEIDKSMSDWLIEWNKELIKRSNYFAVPSDTRQENAINVPNSTPIDEQYLVLSADMSAEIDTMLANAFNMDKASVLAKKIIVDEFEQFTGAGKYNGVYPVAALVSKKSIILRDSLIQMSNIYNPETLSYNYFLHHHQMVSYSLIHNSRIYYTK